MSDFRRPFDPAELDAGTDAELAGLLATARDLEAFARTEGIGPVGDFEDRVMAAIALEAPPRAVATGGLLTSVRHAWGVLWDGGRPLVMRSQALALVLLVAVALGSAATVATVGVARLLEPDAPPPPTVPSPSPSVVPTLSPSPTPAPTSSPTPSPTATPSASPSPTATDRATPRATSRETPEPTETDEPTETPEGGDDSGGGSDSGSGSGSGSDSSGPGSGPDDPGGE